MHQNKFRTPEELCNYCGDIATKHTPSDNPLCNECFSRSGREKGHFPTEEELGLEDRYLDLLDKKLKKPNEKMNDKY